MFFIWPPDVLLQEAGVVLKICFDRFVRNWVGGGGSHEPEHGTSGLQTHPPLKIDLLRIVFALRTRVNERRVE